MDINFSEKKWNVDRDSVVFHASFGDKRIRCVVTYGFLETRYAEFPSEERALESLSTRWSEIASIIQDRFEKNAIEKSHVDSEDEIVLRP
jgi:hypothetical protein